MMDEWDPHEDAPLNPHSMAFRLQIDAESQARRAAEQRREPEEPSREDLAEQVARWDANSTHAPHEAEPNDPFEMSFHHELNHAREAGESEPDPAEMSAEDWDFHQATSAPEASFEEELPEPPEPPEPRDPPWPFRKDRDDYGYEPAHREDDFGR